MKKAYLFFLILQMAAFAMAQGQAIDKKDADTGVFDEIPKENVFVHYNSGVLFSGETLYYKIYCINAERSALSTLSKIAYIELIAADNTFVFKHKIKLASGEGQADFFIPVDVPSGNYKLIGYTQWMKNEGVSSFFLGNVTIINPYGEDRKPIARTAQDSIPNKIAESLTRAPKVLNNSIQLSTNARTYTKREKVSLNLLSLDKSKGYGTYSVSVRKVNAFDTALLKTAENFTVSPAENSDLKNEVIYLPELRGELISGNVLSEETGRPISNAPIAISIPGIAYVLSIVHTDENGSFFFNLDREYDGENGILQLLKDNKEVKIQLDSSSNRYYSNLNFSPFQIDSKMKKLIAQRSVHNQIENAYSEIKQDTLIATEATYPFFYTKNFDVFDLDDYTRFSGVRETFIEVIKYASIRNLNGKAQFLVLPSDPQLNSSFEPLVIVDGILLQDHTDIIAYGAKNIKRILVFRDTYFYGSKGYQGALVFETLNGDYFQRMDKKDKYIAELFKPQPRKRYFQQEYDTNNDSELSHIPDYRYQLLWKPDIVLDIPKKNIEFFTSDITGEFEIRLEGFTNSGNPVSIREIITVE